MINYPKDRFYLTVDAVVFAVLDEELKILLIKRKINPYKGEYALPGGFVNLDESVEDTIKRELLEETGVKNIFLKKLKSFEEPKRDPRGRIITVPFLALINGHKFKLQASTDAELANWFGGNELPKLAFDHLQIIRYGLNKLRNEINNTNIAFQIMPNKFTLTELQEVYELVLEEKLDKRNFRKKIKDLNIIKGLNETKMEGAHRPAKLYSFKDKKYMKY